MASDGKVVISTELDNSGIEKGVKKISGSLGGLKSVIKSLGTAITSVFAVRQIVSFFKESSEAATALSDALTGLQSILEGQGKSFSAAQSFIEEYTQDGLIPATNAINAYKNLALRGYDDSQIQQVMNALKDASAYGRQANYTMGEAVESATEGLKNENSILVDNAGVTKNVAKMWEEYAESIGTTANNLTQQQKIQAEVTGILEETKYQTGDAAKVAGALSGQLQQLSYRFNDLKIAVGNAVNPFVERLLPIVNTAITALTKLANTVASVVGALFGSASLTSSVANTNESIASSASAGAAAEEDLAKATEAAGKAAKKSLAGFDELNRLQGDTDSGSSSASSTSGIGATSSTVTVEAEVEDTLSPKLQAIVDKVRELIEPLKQIDFTPAVEAFGRLKEAVEPLTKKLFEGLEWAWYNILVPLAEWTIEEALPAFLDLVSAALGALNAVIAEFQPLATWLWDNFLQPIAEWTGGVIVDTLNGLADGLLKVSDWISKNQGLVQTMTVTAGAFMAVWKAADLIMWIDAAGGIPGVLKLITDALIGNTVAKIANKAEDIAIIALYIGDYIRAFADMVAKLAANTAAWVANTAAKVASTAAEWAQIAATTAWNGICAIATTVTTAFGAAVAFLTSPIGLVVIAITALIAIIVLLAKNWDEVKEAAANAWTKIKEIWGGVKTWFKEKVIVPIMTFFLNLWKNVMTYASNAWTKVKEIWGYAKTWLKEKVIVPIMTYFLNLWKNAMTYASNAWTKVKTVWGSVKAWFSEKVIAPVKNYFANLTVSIATAFSNAKAKVQTAWLAVKTWFNDKIAVPIKAVFTNVKTAITTAFSTAKDSLLNVWSSVSQWFQDKVATPITNVFNGLKTSIKGVINGIIGFLNRMISGIASGINTVIRALNRINVTIPSWISTYGGKSIGFNLSTISAPSIPYLARGAVLPANKPFLAMVGDQKHGTNVEAPLETIQEAVRMELSDLLPAMVAGFEAVIAENQELRRAVESIEIGDEVIARAVTNYQRKMAVARGG